VRTTEPYCSRRSEILREKKCETRLWCRLYCLTTTYYHPHV